MKNTTTISRSKDWFNPYFFEGKQVKKLIFFKEGQELASINWFTNGVSNNRVPLLDFESPIHNKRKIDLETKQVYFFKDSIYIHGDLVNFEFIDSVREDMEYEIRIVHKFKINILCKVEEGYLNELGEYRTRVTEPQKRELKETYSVDFEPKPQLVEARKLQEDFKNILNVDLSQYDICKILNKYKVINKI